MGAKSDLHSGTYGGSFLNPLVALSRVVGTLHDPSTNKIAIDTFYDDVEDFTKEEIDELGVVDDEAEAKRLGVTAMVGEEGYSTMERRTMRPTLELIGIYGGFQGEGIKVSSSRDKHTSRSKVNAILSKTMRIFVWVYRLFYHLKRTPRFRLDLSQDKTQTEYFRYL